MRRIAYGMTAFVLAAGVAFAPLAASAQTRDRASSERGVAITIRKAPSYLNTRTVARPMTSADYQTSALYQSSTPTRGPGGFERWPLPSTFDVPGY